MKVPNLLKERWALVVFSKPTRSTDYMVSDYGRVKSVHKTTAVEKLIKTRPDHRGFITVSIKLDGGFGCIYVHKEVATHFVEKRSEDCIYVIHPNFKRDNNHHTKIKWVTEAEWKEYIKERKVVFGFKRPPGGGNKKLTRGQVALIKKALIVGKTRKKMIAKMFGVSSTQIKRIERGENWADVDPAK